MNGGWGVRGDFETRVHDSASLGTTRSRVLFLRWVVWTAWAFTPLITAESKSEQFWNTNGVSGIWTSANWGTSVLGPFTTAYEQNSDVLFSTNSTVTFANTSIGNVTVAAGQVVTVTNGDTLRMNGVVRTFDVGTGALLDWHSQVVTANSTAGITKNGEGVLQLDALTFTTAMSGGFTLNAGTIIVSGNKALGSGELTIRGGVLQSSGTRTFAPISFIMGGDFTFSGTGDATFAMPTSLGASTRTITNSTTDGSRILTGKISGSDGAGLVFGGSGDGQIYISSEANDFTGPIILTGAEVGFGNDGSFGKIPDSVVAGAIVLDGGCLTASDTAGGAVSFTLNSNRGMQVGATEGVAINVKPVGTIIYNGIIADKPAATGAWSKQGNGTLVLGGASTYSGGTSIRAGTLQLIHGSNRLPTGTILSLGQPSSTNRGIFDLNAQDQQIAGVNSVFGTQFSSARNAITNSSSVATLTLGGGGSYSYGDGTLTNSGIIAGAVSLVKNGDGTQVLGDANTYSGDTTIAAGTLALRALGSISNSPNITIAGGATLSVSNLNAALTLGSGQALKVSGTAIPGTVATASLKGLVLGGTSPLHFTAYSNTAPLSVSGTGSVTLSAGNPVTVTVTHGGMRLPAEARVHKLIASGSGNAAAVTGIVPSSVSVTGDGIDGIPSLEIYNGELYLNAIPADLTLTAGPASGSPTISSVLNDAPPLMVSQGAQVWQFTVGNPAGMPGDATVSAIAFTQGAANQVDDWATTIQAAELFDGSTALGAGTVTSAGIMFSGLNVTVQDGGSKTLALRISLTSTAGTLAGNHNFQFALESGNVVVTGNGVPPASVSSDQTMNRVAVVATKLGFSGGLPSIVGVNSNFAVTVQAQDANGNVDLDNTATVTITKASGSGSLSAVGGLVRSLSIGTGTWDDLQFNTPGDFQIECSGGSLASATSGTITVAGPLERGDLTILGYRSDATDSFAFVTWKAILVGTVVGFWDHSCNSNGTFRLGEDLMTWTAPPGGIAAGTVVKVSCTTGHAIPSMGTTLGTLDGLAADGDQIFAGVGGTFPPDGEGFPPPEGSGSCAYEGTLLYALNTEANWLTSGDADANDSYRPSSLDGLYQSHAFSTTGDNGQFAGDRKLQTTWADYKALIHTSSQWTRENGGTTILDGTPFVLAVDPPNVTITNPVCDVLWLGQPSAEQTIAGDANAKAAGLLQWSNNLTGAHGTTAAATGWSVTVPLVTGVNIITVTATNADGVAVNDSITIRRMLASQGGGMIISEFMQNSKAVNDGEGEWVELYNPTPAGIDIKGWILKDLSHNYHVISNSVVVPAYGFAVLGISTNSATNGGAPVMYQWPSYQFVLNNDGADELLLLDAAANEVSRVEYSDVAFPWPDPAGASMYLKGPDLDVNDPANWAISTSRQNGFIGGAGDFGSPGGPNPEGVWWHQTVFMFR